MKKQNMKKEYPFEQTGAQNRESTFTSKAISAHALSEMMNPANVNFFGAAYGYTDL